MDITPKELCDIGVCVSQAQARRMIDGMAEYPDASNTRLLRSLIEARAMIAELEAAQRWISADERLPEYHKQVLAMQQGKTTITMCINAAAFRRHVTHWQPLPGPPKLEDAP